MQAAKMSEFHRFGRKIVGVGFNYKSLIEELRVKRKSSPTLFLKAPSSYVTQGNTIQIPDDTKPTWYEVELGVIIKETIKNIRPTEALNSIGGYCTAIDLTHRSTTKAGDCTDTWAVSKSFDTACAIGEFIPVDKIRHPNDVVLWLAVNGELRQRKNTSDMLLPVPGIISMISRFMTLEAGDLILTGTPSGIGSVQSGDVINAGIEDIDDIHFQVE
ncbi:hypothetical protein CAPTEDRAFT_229129 [Capitella teleta]|uniref:oxaloacetate tautomerase n=1 Tax=Capitella teleta TaxID=283909 RepID=R7VGN4_CAPTE|nr:hypothetical protein CAPTEDRAFT_229129 [Capitella teleta]|eukprot:ELU17707.1 hypothetical protein CAPTEDRAFT_229129 [Capitella teleta]